MPSNSASISALRAHYNIPMDAPLVGVFFGTRLADISRLVTPFSDTIDTILKYRPDIHFISAMDDNLAEDILAFAGADMRLQNVILLGQGYRAEILSTIDVALASSSDILSHLAKAGVPTIIAHKQSGLGYMLSRLSRKSSYISEVNIAAGQALMPEFIQGDVTGEKLSAAILERIGSPDSQ